MKRLAARVSKLIKTFWFKIDKVITYKQRLEWQAEQRKAMDRHLVRLLHCACFDITLHCRYILSSRQRNIRESLRQSSPGRITRRCSRNVAAHLTEKISRMWCGELIFNVARLQACRQHASTPSTLRHAKLTCCVPIYSTRSSRSGRTSTSD